jgi:enoyl-CoA hydratase/carnithine racemase
MALAREIASKNPDAVRAAKKLINEVWHGDSGRGLMMESELMMTLMGSPNQMEAVTANFAKQPPKFKDPA